MRRAHVPALLLLLLLQLLGGPGTAHAQPLATPGGEHQAGHAGAVEPPLIPSPRPALVAGELKTARFRILYTRRSETAARELAGRIEQARDNLQAFLGRDWPGTTEIRIGAGKDEMRDLALRGGEPPSWAVALAYPAHNVILLDSMTLSGPEGVNTLWHELAHVALGRLGEGWPRWFQEGLAVHLTGERFDMGRYTTIFRAVHGERIMAFGDLSRAWPDHPTDVELAYAQSAAFVGWLNDRHGSAGLGRLVDAVAAGDPFETAFAKAFKTTLPLEEQAWRDELPARYGWWPVATTGSAAMGLAAIVCIGAWLRRRKLLERRLGEMEAQDAAEEAARRLLEAELRAQELLLAQLRADQGLVINAPPEFLEFDDGELDWDGDDPASGKPTLH